jgi:hypothetical protein
VSKALLPSPTTMANHKECAAYVTKIFKLDDSELLKDPTDMAKAITVILRHYDTFSFDGSFGETPLLEHAVITTSDLPINCRYRPVNSAVEGKLKEQLDKWLKLNVIETAQSPWTFPLEAAPKKSGEIRWCVDFRSLTKLLSRTATRLATSTITWHAYHDPQSSAPLMALEPLTRSNFEKRTGRRRPSGPP